MTAANAFFYIFSAIAVGSAFMVISARNPVHSVLFLILAFVNAAGLFVLLGAEFLAMILIVVYVGAVAVLFLFVIMMLDVDFAELRQGFLQYLPIGSMIGGVVLVELVLVVGSWSFAPTELRVVDAPASPAVSNTVALGRVIYTQYLLFFQAAGMILLTAMIGSIVLTLRHKVSIRRQDIATQNLRAPHTAVAMRKIASGAGLDDRSAA